MPQQTLAHMLELEKGGELAEALDYGRRALVKSQAEKWSRFDKNKVYLALGRLASRLRSDEALEFIDAIVKNEPTTSEEQTVFNKALLTRAIHYMHADKLDMAIKEFRNVEESIHRCEGEEKDYLLSFVYSGFSNIYAKKLDYESIITGLYYTTKCIENKKAVKADCRAELVLAISLHLETSQPTKAAELCQELESIYQNDAFPADQIYASMCSLKSRIQVANLECVKAAQSAREAIQYGTTKATSTIVDYVLALLSLLETLEQYDEMIAIGEIAIPIVQYFPVTAPIQKEFVLYRLLLIASQKSNRSEDAERHFMELQRMSELGTLPQGFIRHFQTQALMYSIFRKDWEEGRTLLKKIEEFSSLQKGSFRQYSLLEMGYFIAQDPSIAMEQRKTTIFAYIEEVLSIPVDEHNRRLHWHISHNIAELLVLIGEKEKAAEYRSKADEYKKICRVTGKEKQQLTQIIQDCKLMLAVFAQQQTARYVHQKQAEFDSARKSLSVLKQSYTTIDDVRKQVQESIRAVLPDAAAGIWSEKNMYNFLTGLLQQLAGENIQSIPEEKETLPPCPDKTRKKLLAMAADLSSKEINFCYLTVKGWDTQSICATLGMQKSSLQKFRYRLARKLNLPKNTKLYAFLLEQNLLE